MDKGFAHFFELIRNKSSNYISTVDPLEEKFQQLELDKELQRIKNNLNQ